ncbi:hypothetical protein CJP74_00870 [Psittacicella melopsittaci]|uniref:Uncharacterized protein n=1 Tax=Psittacicella melopsittaci TaxID=2028576 RepID=A0A3A1Y6D4_9GAMM|nr:TrbC family F-type conjugative pilus assembly protein [Psittacicella melopsittaci]RIY33822.1 hypothetical protein CJP74_00870 [Psittacicella melopsittaci]
MQKTLAVVALAWASSSFAISAQTPVTLKVNNFWSILASQSLDEASLVNVLREAYQANLPVVFPGVLGENWSEGIVALQQRLAQLERDYSLPGLPEVSIDPRPFRALGQKQVPVLVYWKGVQADSPYVVPAEQLVPVYQQYGNVAWQLARTYYTHLEEQAKPEQQLYRTSLARIQKILQEGQLLYLQQLQELGIKLKRQTLTHAFGAGQYFVPANKAKIVQQGKTFSLIEEDLLRQARAKVLDYLATKPQVDYGEMLEKHFAQLETKQKTPLVTQEKEEIVPLPQASEQVFPLQVWFVDLSLPALQEQLLALPAPTLQNYFTNSQRVVLLTGLDCPQEPDTLACFAFWQERLGTQLYLALPTLMQMFKPSALTLLQGLNGQELEVKHLPGLSLESLLGSQP